MAPKNVKILVKNLAAQDVGEIELSPTVFQAPPRDDIVARVVHWQLNCRRAGTHKTKGISDVSGTTRKPYKQKGTGRARQGSLRSPQFRGGAVIFGPVVRSHATALPKKVRALGLRSVLSSRLASGALTILDSLALDSHKTKAFRETFSRFGHDSILIISGPTVDPTLKNACANLPTIDVLPQTAINVYDILRHRHLMMTREAASYLEERLLNS